LIRFVETSFDQRRTEDEVRAFFGPARHVSVNPMPLRAIFLSIARSGPKAG